MKDYVRLTDIQAAAADDPVELFALDVLMGLSSTPKSIPPKYFYDTRGSELFQKITDTEDYYPTSCEAEILSNYADKFSDLIDSDELNIIELGAGDGRKTKLLLPAFLNNKTVNYCPIDISESAIVGLIDSLRQQYPTLSAQGVVAEYFPALRWMRDNNSTRNLVLFLGSNIGNFNPAQAQVFLRTMWNSLNPGDYVLLGCDLKKNIDVMLRAYNDSQGHTRAFNINLLKRMNEELSADFNLDAFDHFGTYNVKLGAMESFLLSTRQQTVHIPYLNKRFEFSAYEPVHVEFSFKYLPEEIETMANETGYRVIKQFTDSRCYFADALLTVVKD